MAFTDTTWYVNYGDGSTTGYYAVPVWPGALSAVTAGTWCRQLTAPAVGSERCYVCIVAGTTGAAEPVWVTTRGADTGALIDGTVTWQECTGMPGPCGDLTNSSTWVASTAVGKGIVIYDVTSGSLQICSTNGTSKSGGAPSFSATAGVTTADNTATWTSLGATSNYTNAFKYPHARLANAFASTWGAAGNSFAVASNHAETQSTGITLTSPGTAASPCAVYCLSNTTTLASPTLATTATISPTGGSAVVFNSGFIYFYGIQCFSGSSSNTASVQFSPAAAAGSFYFENCIFQINNTAAASRFLFAASNNNSSYFATFYGCQFIFGNASQSGTIGGTRYEFVNCTFAGSGTVPTTLFGTGGGGGGDLLIRDSDLSGVTGTIVSVGGANITGLRMENCKVGAGVTFVGGTYASLGTVFLIIQNCDSTSTNYRYYYGNYVGSIQQETTIVRTSSYATNGTTPISWAVSPTANCKFLQPFKSEEISVWNDLTGSALTATFYLISSVTLNNDDFWVELEHLGTSSFPLGVTVSSRKTPLASATALTADTSTWGGSTNKYKVALSFTPQNKGHVKARFFMGKNSGTTYVDPIIYITDASSNLKSIGRSYFIPGCGYISETAPSFMRLGAEGNIHG